MIVNPIDLETSTVIHSATTVHGKTLKLSIRVDKYNEHYCNRCNFKSEAAADLHSYQQKAIEDHGSDYITFISVPSIIDDLRRQYRRTCNLY